MRSGKRQASKEGRCATTAERRSMLHRRAQKRGATLSAVGRRKPGIIFGAPFEKCSPQAGWLFKNI